MLEQSIEDDALDVFGGGGISNVVSGMEVATYQLLSQNSYTMMNLSFLGLPDWMPHIETIDDASLFVALVASTMIESAPSMKIAAKAMPCCNCTEISSLGITPHPSLHSWVATQVT
ncbi:MAG: hypothetical protein R2856_29515 [Caldilineaceae bacterium]